MKYLRRFFVAFLGVCLMATAAASPSSPKKNVDYIELTNPQETFSNGKVEVIEFFGYFCPHCFAMDSYMVNWARKNSHRVTLRRVCVKFSESMANHQNMFYTLAAMDKLTNDVHAAVFKAVQIDDVQFTSPNQMAAFLKPYGIDEAKFKEMYQSFYVKSLALRAEEMQNSYQIDSVPMIIVDGRFQTSPGLVSFGNNLEGSEEVMIGHTIRVLNHLVDRVWKEKKSKKK